MDFSPKDKANVRILANLFLDGKNTNELTVMRQQLATEDLRKSFATLLGQDLQKSLSTFSDEKRSVYVQEIVEKIFSSIENKLSQKTG